MVQSIAICVLRRIFCIEEWENVRNSCKQYEVKLIRLSIECTRLTHGHLTSRNDNNQHAQMQHMETRHSQSNVASNGGTAEEKYNMKGNIKIILEIDC